MPLQPQRRMEGWDIVVPALGPAHRDSTDLQSLDEVAAEMEYLRKLTQKEPTDGGKAAQSHMSRTLRMRPYHRRDHKLPKMEKD